jgi:hypothetical protein
VRGLAVWRSELAVNRVLRMGQVLVVGRGMWR